MYLYKQQENKLYFFVEVFLFYTPRENILFQP